MTRSISFWIIPAAIALAGCGKPGETGSPSEVERPPLSETGTFELLSNASNAEWRTSNLPGCVEFRRKCTSTPIPPQISPGRPATSSSSSLGAAAAPAALQINTPGPGDFIDLGRKIIELLAKLEGTDKAILACAGDSTKTILRLAAQCKNNACIESVIGGFNAAAQISCSVSKCLAKVRPEAAFAAGVCDLGNKLAKNIECFGGPMLGGGLAGLCENEVKISKPIVLQACQPSTINSVRFNACSSTGAPLSLQQIESQCASRIANLRASGRALNEGGCQQKCAEAMANAAANCQAVSAPATNGSCWVGGHESWTSGLNDLCKLRSKSDCDFFRGRRDTSSWVFNSKGACCNEPRRMGAPCWDD